MSSRGTRWAPLPRWRLFGFLLLVVAASLGVRGFTSDSVGASSTLAHGGRVAPAAPEPGPILDLSGPAPVGTEPPPRTVALTFDDGPDSKWTPRVLELLRRHHVPATFFVVGSKVLAHPGLVRAELAAGHEIGVHTFTHADLTRTSGWRTDLELGLTQSALAGAAGVQAVMLRPPYSSRPDAVRTDQAAAYQRVARYGYLVVLSDVDSRDWEREGVPTILAQATPPGNDGGIVLMHDSGGDRAQTLGALDRLIPELQARGYRFVTVSQAAGLHRADALVPSNRTARIRGLALLWSNRVALLLSGALLWLVLPLSALMVLRALLMFAFARRHARWLPSRVRKMGGSLPGVTVVVPAYNEEVGVQDTVRSLLASVYPGELEIIVVDDGSTDGTAAAVLAMHEPGLLLVRQENTGKPGALRNGIARAAHQIVVLVDGDTQLEPDAIRALVQPLADPRVGAVSGNAKVGNRRRMLGRWQHLEYVMGFNLDRRMYELLDCMPTVPGAIGAFRRSALTSVGGLSDDTLAEDTDVTIALLRGGWRVVFEPTAIAWTEAPSTLRGLWRQRYRWSYGTMQSLWKHRSALWSRRSGHFGRRSLPYLLLFQIGLPLLAPVIDLFVIYGVLFLGLSQVLPYVVAFTLIQLGLGAYALRLDGESLRPLWALPLQQLVYRQMLSMVIISSLVSAAVGTRLRWHKLRRTGGIVLAARSPG